MRVAITADWLTWFGGAERVLLELHRIFPDAPVFTSVHDPRGLPPEMQGLDVRTSFLQRIPFARRRHQAFFPLMPLAFEEFDLDGFDLIISSSYACSKGIIPRPGSVHVCYCHTPTRYLWDGYHEYTRGHRAKWLIAPVAHRLRSWDRLAADRVDHFVANSAEVAGRIRRHYRRESSVIHPPVDVDQIRPSGADPEDFYLVVSRLVQNKRVDLAVQAATRLGRRLLVAGTGPEQARLRAMAGPTVEFLGWLGDEEVRALYARCRAFLFPGFDDFGITPVEAQAAGRPVIAFGRGGARETVVDGVTGVLFGEQTAEALAAAMVRFEREEWEPAICRRNAERFRAEEFRRRMSAFVEQALADGSAGPTTASAMHAPALAADPA